MTHSKHTYFGEEKAEPLLRWLNETPARKTRRVIALLEKIGNVHPEQWMGLFWWGPQVRRFLKRSAGRNAPVAPMQGMGEQPKLLMEINLEITRLYRAVPSLTFQAGSLWRISWSYGKGQRADVGRAVHLIIQLAELGVLHSVRRCTGCGKWFYARFNHQRGCGKTACRQKVYSSKSESKARRNKRNRQKRAEKRLRAEV